ncbi:DUF6515 family protein [Pseudanabaena sp. PCC 6802]|uniref:DUF6515 family protein n=1 Tax=Pseudanabaena sp. PCC 6802 TaxID=118173 RepID=UPI000346DBD2|nr:DUF6515 family protein [Pseudanabaena sp. PCC 6802]
MKFSTRYTFFTLLLVLLSASLLPLDAFAQRRGGNVNRAGASPRVNSNVNLRDRGNINRPNANRPNINRPNNNINRPNVNVNRPNNNINRPNVNVNRPNTNINRPNVNVNRPNINVNRPNVNVNRPNVNINTGWRGGGWYGGGYRTPPGWGLATFATGLAIGTAINNRPPYAVPVVVGGNNFIYSDGVFLQPRGNSYVVIAPPIGAVVPSIPDGCTVTNTDGVIYYNCSGVIYQPFYQGNNLVYRVVRF